MFVPSPLNSLVPTAVLAGQVLEHSWTGLRYTPGCHVSLQVLLFMSPNTQLLMSQPAERREKHMHFLSTPLLYIVLIIPCAEILGGRILPPI